MRVDLLWTQSFWTNIQPNLKALGDAMSSIDKRRSCLASAMGCDGSLEQAKPALEMRRRQIQRLVRTKRLTTIPAAPTQNRRPKVNHRCEMFVPAFCKMSLEDGAEHKVLAYAAVKGVHNLLDQGFRHGRRKILRHGSLNSVPLSICLQRGIVNTSLEAPMKLSSHTDYGLRILMALAVMNDRLVTIEELADRHKISRNHLMKVAQTLVSCGFVKSIRGRKGGLTLAMDPAAVRIGAVVRALEKDMNLASCFGDGPMTCILVGVCELTGALRRASAAFLTELDRLTLEDAVLNRIKLRRRLGL